MTETFDVFTPPHGGVVDSVPPGFAPPPAPAAVQVPPTAPEPPAAAVPEGAHLMPSGNWVLIGDPKAITRGDKKNIIAAVKPLETPAEIGFAVADVLLTQLVTAWSYPLSLPREDASVLDQIPGSDDEAISELIKPARALLFPSLVTPDDYADERSPTGPSGE